MAGLSDSIQARLKALGEAFLEELPRRMDALAAAARNVLGSDTSIELLTDLRHHAHRLAGSAATFGFHHVTACAKRLEHQIDRLVDEGRLPDRTEREAVRMLVSELSEAARIRSSDAALEELEEVDDSQAAASSRAPEPVAVDADATASEESGVGPAGPGDGTRTVAILTKDPELSEQLSSRFSFYGFETLVLESAPAIGRLADLGGQTALVMDVSFVREDPTVAETIRGVEDSAPGRLHVVYLSDHDDFRMRLLGVRSAGGAFFSSPYDISRIIDMVDGLTSEAAGEPYHILIVDDDTEQVSYHALILQKAGMITSVVSDPQNVFSVLIEAKPDLILMDMYMPGCSGPELASIIRQQEAFVGIPIVFLSIETDEDKQFQALSRGGDGFLSKPIKPEHLVTAITHRVDRTRSMRFFMERDSLTGLLNHTNLMESLSTEVQRSERVNCQLCFAMIDIDHFKRVNDSHGHLTGDRVLKSLARLLTDRLRKTDVIGRYGGEEFGIVMFNVDTGNAERILNSIREDFSHLPHEAEDGQFTVTFSCGVASFPAFDGPGPISEAADNALYKAKESGRNRVIVAEPDR
jgi:diguanylate cyclase (GGDEF)-like protein